MKTVDAKASTSEQDHSRQEEQQYPGEDQRDQRQIDAEGPAPGEVREPAAQQWSDGRGRADGSPDGECLGAGLTGEGACACHVGGVTG
ncbi:hypothetical protein [Nocardia uniformis]|uniref:hypothetical protein n=1 Tax=Nocardia uniformis TaxID=53432 RepID=UPI00082D5DA0